MVFLGISAGKARQGKVNSQQPVSWSDFGGLRAGGVVSSCVAPDPGMIKAEGSCLLGNVAARGGVTPDWLVSMSQAGSWLSPSLSLKN